MYIVVNFKITCCFVLLQYKQALSIQLRKATLHRNRTLQRHVLRAWADYSTEEKIASWRKEKLAKEHNLE